MLNNIDRRVDQFGNETEELKEEAKGMESIGSNTATKPRRKVKKVSQSDLNNTCNRILTKFGDKHSLKKALVISSKEITYFKADATADTKSGTPNRTSVLAKYSSPALSTFRDLSHQLVQGSQQDNHRKSVLMKH